MILKIHVLNDEKHGSYRRILWLLGSSMLTHTHPVVDAELPTLPTMEQSNLVSRGFDHPVFPLVFIKVSLEEVYTTHDYFVKDF